MHLKSLSFLLLCAMRFAPALAQQACAGTDTRAIPASSPDTAERVDSKAAMQSASKACGPRSCGPTTIQSRPRATIQQQDRGVAQPQIEQSIRARQRGVPQINAASSDAQKSIERAIANMPDPNYPKR